MNKIPGSYALTAAFITIFMGGTILQSGFSFPSGGCAIDKNPLPASASPYTVEVNCYVNEVDQNGTILYQISDDTYWCKRIDWGALFGGGLLNDECILHVPGGRVDTATTEPKDTQGASPGLNSIQGSANDSKHIGNDLAVNKNKPPMSDLLKNESLDTSQLKQVIPITPSDGEEHDKEDNNENGKEENEEESNN
jgi:hypothetical protein